MMKIFTLLMILLPVFGYSQLAGWNFNGVSSPATLAATAVNPNLNQSVTLTRGSGATASTATSSFRTAGFGNNGIDVTNDDYFQFELQAAAGFKMSLSSIDAQVKGTGTFAAAPGVSNQFAYSIDGTTFTLIGTPHVVTSANAALPTTDLSGIAALQNVNASTTVTFRFYASGQTTTGGWGFSSSTPLTENLVIGGTTAAVVPCPIIPAPTATGTSTCSGSTATLTATASETGSTLSWFNVASGGTAIGTGASFTTPALTSMTSFWVEEAVAGCPESARTEVVVNISGTAPIAVASNNSPICAGQTINLTSNAVAGATYAWTGPNSFTSAVQNPTIAAATALASGTYNLTITDGGCTSAISSVTVVVNSLPVVSAGADKDVCAGLAVTLNGSGATTYVWNNNVTNNVSFVPSATAIFTVVGTDANGCVGTDMVEVTVNPLPVVTVSVNELTLTASLTSVDYQWINCGNNTDIVTATAQAYTATANGSYKVEVTDANGCIATSSCSAISTVGVEAKTAIESFNLSPNPTKGKVTITAAGNESASVVIFNALGQEVSRANNIQNGSVIDFTAFNNGVYMVQITTNKGTKVQRVVKN